ncbi:MAG: hypothetical protein PHH30_09680 [Bacteroidales bacterium]|nr:hypothetical protein [Bacteroidales bacterium]MDD3859974.1 hypothetical protein [Bacteroidales bacterium]
MLFIKHIVFFLFASFCLISFSAKAQFKIEVFTGIAVNPVDRPCLISAGLSPGYEYKNFSMDYAMDFNINHRDNKAINAFATNLAYKINVKNNPLKFSLFYCNKPVSHMLIIHNTGLKINYSLKKWEFILGNNFNIYRFTDNAVEIYGIDDNQYLIEAANIMYSVKYFFMQNANPWNVYFNLTNFEKFIIEQETNPMFNLGFIWQKNNNYPEIYVDYCYQSAGLNNIRVNYFGWILRIGAKWEIN